MPKPDATSTSCDALGWYGTGVPLSETALRDMEARLGIELPADVRECLRRHHGAKPHRARFRLPTGGGRELEARATALLRTERLSAYGIEAAASRVRDAGVAGLLPLFDAEPWGVVCLDFRTGSREPSITYLDWGRGGATHLADSFAEFCRTLLDPPCDECGARIPPASSRMASLCSDCASRLYGY